MSLVDDIKALQANLIPDNTNNEISPKDVRDSLDLILDNLQGLGSNYYGTVTTSDSAITGIKEGGYVLPTEYGIYSNFNNLERSNELCIFVYTAGNWVKKTIQSIEDVNTDVFVKSAFRNTGNSNLTTAVVRDMNAFISGVKFESIESKNIVMNRFTKTSYLGRAITIEFSLEVSEGVFEKFGSFFGVSNSFSGVFEHDLTIETAYRDLINGKVILNWSALDLSTVYNAVRETSDTITFDFYGINPSNLTIREYNRSDSIIIDTAIKKLVLFDKDDFRNYSIKTFSYNASDEFILELRTDVNEETVTATTQTIEGSGVQKVQWDDGYVVLDVKYLKDNNISFSTKNIPIIAEHRNKYNKEISAGSEFISTYDGNDLWLHDCGKSSDMFYLSDGLSIYKTDHIKDVYLTTDLDKTIFLVTQCPDPTCNRITDVQELDNGEVIYSAEIPSTQGTNTTYFSRIYKSDFNGVSTKQFTLSWVYVSHPDSAATLQGGNLTDVWSFDNYKNIVVVSERADQAVGGRIWISDDYGTTWKVIFNPHKATSAGAYPIMHPSGWDYSTPDPGYPTKVDFERPVAGTASYPFSYMHTHAVCYDPLHNRIYVTTGDATWIKGSYTAIWYCDDWQTAPDLAGGTLDPLNPIKLKNTTWTRIGLYQDENLYGENLQFTTCKYAGDWILLGSDAGGGNGVNGLWKLKNDAAPTTNSLFSIYQLSKDSEVLLTHAGGGAVIRDGLPYIFCFHRESTNFDPGIQDNKREAHILISSDGNNWRRAWLDDTLDELFNTKITWGMQMYINKSGEAYLRYADDRSSDRTIRRFVL